MLLFLPQLKPRTHPYGGEPPIQPAAEAHGVSSGGAASGVASTSVAGASSDDRSDPDDSGAVAFFVKGASEEQRDAHYRSQRWAHALPWQIDRLYAARLHAMESHRAVLEAGFYPDEGRWPFMKMDAEAHFALVAARQLLRALRAFDGDDRLPPGLTNRQVRDVRDALEHWDTPGGSDAAKRLSQQGADPTSHVWFDDGSGVLGGVVADSVLRKWAVDVYAELLDWDPFDGWRHR